VALIGEPWSDAALSDFSSNNAASSTSGGVGVGAVALCCGRREAAGCGRTAANGCSDIDTVQVRRLSHRSPGH
jgi:hypothetical protein